MRYFHVLTISLIFHLGLALLISRLPAPPISQPKDLNYVSLLETPELRKRPLQPSSDQKTFIQSHEVPEELRTEKDKKARMASDEERDVLEETKARSIGATANRSPESGAPGSTTQAGQGRKPNPLNFNPTSALERAKKELHEGSVAVPKMAQETETLKEKKSAKREKSGFSQPGFSSLGTNLPEDIKFGEFTALNTDRHLYYTFFSRIEEKIRGPWENYARSALYNLPPQVIRINSDKDVQTKLEIVLDREGKFIRAILHQSSGIHSFDNAPAQAFRDAAQFPNPPIDMVKEDGTIRLFYTFNIVLDPRYAAR